MSTFYNYDLVEQWRTGKRPPRTERSEAGESKAIDREHIFNREFKSRLLANDAKNSLLARKILIEMYVDRLNRVGESGTK